MNNVIDIDSARPHITKGIKCGSCDHEWRAVYPDGTYALECPVCFEYVNEYGTVVLHRNCDTCGLPYSVCPKPERLDGWGNCMDPACDSYDPARDADKLFDAGLVKKKEIDHEED